MMKITKILSIILLAVAFAGSEAEAKVAAKHDFVVVIDAGHGGKDIGATDNNVKEKDINLGVAKKLAARIRKELKGVKVVMTRDNDTYITLQERADIANRNKGNLFISIHTNSVDRSNPNRKKVSGSSVYALGLHKDQNNLQVARRENSVIELEKDYEQKYSGFDPSKDESYIIFEMAQKKNLGQSLKFASLAQKHLVKDASRADRGVKQAGFWVLWATSMPAVLVELDFICNPNSAVFMGSEKGQDKLSGALFKAVEKYVDLQRDKDNTASAAEESTVTESEGTPLIASAPEVRKTVEAPAAPARGAVYKRRRRSDAARKASALRNVETAAIPLHRENERVAIVEKKSEQYVASANATEKSDETKKSKKKKKRDSKKSEKSKSGNVRTYKNKQVVVNPDGSLSPMNGEERRKVEPKRHQAASSYHSKVGKITTVYKIQILASADLLKQNNPRFCGLTPIKSFKENNLYKYTYGESENLKEIEALLKSVKEKIPDAFIISNRK